MPIYWQSDFNDLFKIGSKEPEEVETLFRKKKNGKEEKKAEIWDLERSKN